MYLVAVCGHRGLGLQLGLERSEAGAARHRPRRRRHVRQERGRRKEGRRQRGRIRGRRGEGHTQGRGLAVAALGLGEQLVGDVLLRPQLRFQDDSSLPLLCAPGRGRLLSLPLVQKLLVERPQRGVALLEGDPRLVPGWSRRAAALLQSLQLLVRLRALVGEHGDVHVHLLEPDLQGVLAARGAPPLRLAEQLLAREALLGVAACSNLLIHLRLQVSELPLLQSLQVL
mmetsp:Transcript_21770/g.60842  ORF Transcript_21770/g.60842 Transcript_21770/m.60842 type:complete len:228 (-) Transcript_21770:1031-1714(-)